MKTTIYLSLTGAMLSLCLTSCFVVVAPPNSTPGVNPPKPPAEDYSRKKLQYAVSSIQVYSLPKKKRVASGLTKANWDAPGAWISEIDRRYPDVYAVAKTKKSGRLFKTDTKVDHNPETHASLKAPLKFVDWSANNSMDLQFYDNDAKKDDYIGGSTGFWVRSVAAGVTKGSKTHTVGGIHFKVNFKYRWVNK